MLLAKEKVTKKTMGINFFVKISIASNEIVLEDVLRIVQNPMMPVLQEN